MKKLWCVIKELRGEAAAALAALILFMASPYLLRWIDPLAGTYDAGVLQVIIFSIVAVLTFSFLSWLGMLFNFGYMFRYLQKDFKNEYQTLNAWQKLKLALLVYCVYLLCFVLMARVL